MAFDLFVFLADDDVRLDEARATYQAASQESVNGLRPSDEFQRLYVALSALFPDPEARNGDSHPRLDCEVSECFLWISIGWGDIAEVAPVIVEAASKRGLTIYDPQGARLILPSMPAPSDWDDIQRAGATVDDEAFEAFVAELDELEREMDAAQ